MSSEYLTKEEFNKHIAEMKELMSSYNEFISQLMRRIDTFTEIIETHEKCIQHNHELLKHYFE